MQINEQERQQQIKEMQMLKQSGDGILSGPPPGRNKPKEEVKPEPVPEVPNVEIIEPIEEVAPEVPMEEVKPEAPVEEVIPESPKEEVAPEEEYVEGTIVEMAGDNKKEKKPKKSKKKKGEEEVPETEEPAPAGETPVQGPDN
jgi:hypothetical protein